MKVDDMREEYGPIVDRRKKAVSHNLLSVYKLLKQFQAQHVPGSPIYEATNEASQWVEDYRSAL